MPRPSIGDDIRERLLEAGSRGVVIADIFKDMKGRQTRATYCSFARYFWLFKKLGFIEPTTETEVAWSATDWGKNPGLPDRAYFRMSSAGRKAPPHQWTNPMRTLFDRVHGRGAWKEYMKEHRKPSTGRPRGRPREVWGPY